MRYKIEIQHKEKTYQAEYYLEKDIVTVEAPSKDGEFFARLSTQKGGTPIKMVARMLLRDLIEAGRV